jgi:hypothetical protein
MHGRSAAGGRSATESPAVLTGPSTRFAWLLQWKAGQRKTVYLCMVTLASCTLVMMLYGLKIWTDYAGRTPDNPPEFGDFFALWSYGKIIAGHPASSLYAMGTLHALQVALGMRESAFNPFPYPPVAILLFRPLTLLPYGTTYLVWTLGTLALFVWAVAATCSRMGISVAGIIVAPVTIGCIASGQSGFLAAALLTGGVRLAGRRPILGGILIGLLAYKPQMAMLVPIAFAAAGYGRAFAAACVTVILLASSATLAYGSGIWSDWLAMLPAYAAAFDTDPVHMTLKPTIMANLQLAGVALPLAKAIQGLVSITVAVLVWRCFRQEAGRLAAAALLVGTVLATPHALIYDLPIVAAAMALFIQERMVTNPVFSLGEVGILILGYIFPLLMLMKMKPAALPVSAVPLVLLFGLILRDARRAEPVGRGRSRNG